MTSKQIKDLNVKLEAIKILDENTGSKIMDVAHNTVFQASETKEKMGLRQSQKFLHSKGNHQQNEKTTHWMGNHIH